jgi:hypothetical protein
MRAGARDVGEEYGVREYGVVSCQFTVHRSRLSVVSDQWSVKRGYRKSAQEGDTERDWGEYTGESVGLEYYISRNDEKTKSRNMRAGFRFGTGEAGRASEDIAGWDEHGQSPWHSRTMTRDTLFPFALSAAKQLVDSNSAWR